jgi:ribosomal protein S18 acetylase RimI-like enzyme
MKEIIMIRNATIEDCSRIAEIHVFGWRCAYKNFISLDHLFNEFTVKIREEKFIEYLSDKSNLENNYIYEDENIIKAFFTIGNCRDDDKNEKTFELMGIYVDPIFQRQKIGTQIVNYTIEDAISKNKNEIVLWVFEKNNESIIFYEKFGFNKDGKSKLMEYFNEYAIRMSKKLVY